MLGANSTFSTYRLETSNGKKTFGVSAHLSSVSGYIEKARLETQMMLDGQASLNIFNLFTDEILDIIVGDKVVDSSENVYIVKAVQSFSGNEDADSHMECILAQKYD